MTRRELVDLLQRGAILGLRWFLRAFKVPGRCLYCGGRTVAGVRPAGRRCYRPLCAGCWDQAQAGGVVPTIDTARP